jgi:subtilisin family serine protease
MKKIYSYLSYLAVAMLFWTLSFAQTTEISKNSKVLPTHNQMIQKDNKSIKAYAEGEAIVILKKDLSKSTVSSMLTQKEIKVLKEYTNLGSKDNGSYLLISGNTSTESLISELQKDPNVQSVSPNYRRVMSAIPDDTYFGDLWGLHQSNNDVDIDAPEAWDTETGSLDVVVAVFDTGVDYTHEDLSANMWVNSAEANGARGTDDDGNGYVDDVYGYDVAGNHDGVDDPDPMDIMGHGTHVSGTIGARGNNSKGITGVNWEVKIMALKVFRPDMGAYTNDILDAIDYVLEMKNNHNVNIVAINASYGGGGGSQGDPMDIAIQSLGDAGIIFAAAAGNGGSDGSGDNNDATPHYPSSYSATNIIAVAATDKNDNLASFSNYGVTSVDIAAPGVNILSTLPSFNMPYNHNIFFDDVESGTNNWETSGTFNKWQITDENAYSNSLAWSDSPNENYNNSADALLSYSLDIDLSGYTNNMISLGACLKYELEEDYDYLYIEASGDSGSNWTALGSINGSTSNNWACNGVLIPNNLKTSRRTI